MKRNFTFYLFVKILALPLVFCLPMVATAQGVLKTWDGGAGTNVWSDAANWDLDVLPANTDSVVIAVGQDVRVTSGTAVCRKLGIYGKVTVTAALTVDAATAPGNTNNISTGHATISLFGGILDNQGTVTVTGRQNLDAIRFDNPLSGSANSTYMGAGTLTCNTSAAAGTGAATGGNNGTIMTFAQTSGTATFTTSSSATYNFTLNTGGTKTVFYCPKGGTRIGGTGTITINGGVRSIRVIPSAANETPNLTIESGVTMNISTTVTTASIGMVLLDPSTLAGASVSVTNKGTLNFSGDINHPIYMTNSATAGATTNFTNDGTININGTFNTPPSTPAVANNSGGIFMAGTNITLGNVFTNSGFINFNTTSGGTSTKPLFILSVSPKNLLTNSGTITVGTNGTPPIALRLGDAETTVNNTGTITVGAGSIEGVMASPPTIVGNALFNNNAGGTLNFNSTSTVTNSFVTFINAGGTFNAATTQTIARLTTNGGTVSVADGTTLSIFFLTLISGHINLGTGNLIIQNGGNITGGSLAAHIVTNGTGTLTQSQPLSMDKMYPIGQSASSYDPVTINHDKALTFSARVGLQTTPISANNNGLIVNREWDITLTGDPGIAYMTFESAGLNKNGSSTRPSGTVGVVGHYDGTNWDLNIPAEYATNTWTIAGYTGTFLHFIVAAPGVIPIELLGITAKAVNNKNVVAWETATEINNKGFDVQRQTANGAWETLGFVKGANRPSTYTFEDNTPLSISYYRLLQMDFDGKETLSKVVSVSQNQKGKIHISPNPASDKVNIILPNSDRFESTTVTVYDLIGRQVLTQKTTANAVELDMSNLAKGTYLVKIDANNSIYTEKIIRQ